MRGPRRTAAAAAGPPSRRHRAGRGAGRHGAVLAGFSIGRPSALTPGTPAADTESFQAFWDAYPAITDRYAGGPVDRKSLVEGAIKGMIGSLDDPYWQYLTSDEYKASLRASRASSRASARDRDGDRPGATSLATLGRGLPARRHRAADGSPAEKAGLLAGDVDRRDRRRPLAGLTVDQARAKVRGPKDTTVTLPIRRGGGEPFDVAIVRGGHRPARGRDGRRRRRKVGYIKLAGFSEHAADEFDERHGRRRARRHQAHPRPARQSGRVRHGGPRHRQRVPRRPGRSSGSRTPTAT